MIINEQSARPDKTPYECYCSSKEEKFTRSALKSEFDKYVVGDKKTLVILDSMNYIKGFRYELHCISKAMGEKHAVVWLLCGETIAKKWNDQRRKSRRGQNIQNGQNGQNGQNVNGEKDEDQNSDNDKDYFYTEEMMDELMQRYEPPDQRNRWDRPLYRVDVHSTLSDSDLEDLNLNMNLDMNLDVNMNSRTSKEANKSKIVDGTSSKTSNDGDNDFNNSNGNDDQEDQDETSRTAAKILNKSVYNMHSLSDAIKDSTQSKTVTSNKKMGSSFRRATATAKVGARSGGVGARPGAGAGFRRANKQQTTTTVKDKNDGNNNTVTREMEITATTTQIPKKTDQKHKRQVKKMEDLVDAILDSFLLDVEPLKEGQSTKLSTAAATNVLNDVDSISQDVATAFLNAQQNSTINSTSSGGKIFVQIGSGKMGKTFGIQVNKTVSVLEMKRLRRQYVRWVKDYPPKDTSKVGIATSFLSFLENNL